MQMETSVLNYAVVVQMDNVIIAIQTILLDMICLTAAAVHNIHS